MSRPDDRQRLADLRRQDLKMALCLRCGYCCRTSVCAFGTWDAAARRCAHLTSLNECSIYAQITALPRELWIDNPAFGAGCCSSLNSDRQALSLRLRPALGEVHK